MLLLGWRSSVGNTTGGCRHLGVRGATETPSNTSMTRSPPAGRLSPQWAHLSLVGKSPPTPLLALWAFCLPQHWTKRTCPNCRYPPILDISQVAITMVYRYQPPASAP